MFKKFDIIDDLISKKVTIARNINVNHIIEVYEHDNNVKCIYLSDGRSFLTTTNFTIIQYKG